MSARKSTTRRKPASKSHVPYNDDLGQGKRTGRSIHRVRNDSDGFERFSDIVHQAYGQSPPRVANKAAASKRNRMSTPGPGDHHSVYSDDDEKDSDRDVDMDLDSGEQSMEIDDSQSRYWQPRRAADPVSPPSPPPRAVARSFHTTREDNDNDHYLSPPQLGMEDADIMDDLIDAPSPSEERSSKSRARASGRSDITQTGSKNSSKRSHHETEEDTAVEQFPDAADVDQDQDEPEVEPEDRVVQDSPPPKKRKRTLTQPKPASVKSKPREPVNLGKDIGPNTKSNNHVIVREAVQDAISDDDPEGRGLRRSKRTHYPPLEWWRLEKVVYGRRTSGVGSVVPVVKEIIRRPLPAPEPLRKQYRRRKSTKPPSSKSVKKPVQRDATPEDEEGLDEQTDPLGEVHDYVTGDIVQRRVAFTAAMVNPKPAEKNDFLFQKIFGDGDFIAAGQLVIPPGKSKPVKPSRDNSYVFYLIEGAVRFQVHQSEFVITTGGMFMAPRGNYYLIKNVASRPARIFFAQARKVAPESSVAITTPRRTSGAPNGPRSSESRALVTTSKGKS